MKLSRPISTLLHSELFECYNKKCGYDSRNHSSLEIGEDLCLQGTGQMSLVRSYAFALFLILLLSLHNGIPDSCESDSIDQLSRLENRCFDTTHISNWWSYIWCFRQEIRQVHYDESHQIVETNKLLGSYILEESRALKEVYRRNISDCDSADGTLTKRHAIVEISCCRDEKWSAMHDRFRSIAELGTFIESVTEPTQCSYLLKVCSELVCAPTNKAKKLVECASNLIFRGDNEQISDKFSNSDSFELAGPDFVDFLVDQITHIQFDKDIDGSSAISAYMSKAIQAAHLDRVRKMFNHGYDMYMLHAQPEVNSASRINAYAIRS